jgi:hypothetical protein
MSLILDALRKIEEERRYGEHPKDADSAPRPGAHDASRERRSLGLRAGTMAAIALASAALTAGVLRLFSPEPETGATPPQPAVVQETAAPIEPEPEAETSAAEPRFHAPDPPPRKSVLDAPPPPPTETAMVEETPAAAAEEAESESVEPPGVFRLVGQGSPNRTAAFPATAPSPAEADPGLPELVLQGTSVIDGKPVAVISDQRVFEGDHIHGAVVIRIQERAVELEYDGRRFTLTL